MERGLQIKTPLHVWWRRVQQQIVPFLAVMLCMAVAWRLWRESPQLTVVGQVDVASMDVRAPASGRIVEPRSGEAPRMWDTVTAGQSIARVEHDDGKWSELITPMGGQISKIHHSVGDSVTSGQKVYTIVAEQGRTITTYLRSDQRISAEPGMTVSVRQRSDAGKTFSAIVERVGVQYESVPTAQLRDHKTKEWGRPVILSLSTDADLRPGELVYIAWYQRGTAHPRGTGTGTSAAADR